MHAELNHWVKTAAVAHNDLALAKADLQKRQDVKRILSERLFLLLMDSEEMRHEKLQSVERSLETLTQKGGGDGGHLNDHLPKNYL